MTWHLLYNGGDTLKSQETEKDRQEAHGEYPGRLFIIPTLHFRWAAVEQYMSQCRRRPSLYQNSRNWSHSGKKNNREGPVYWNHPKRDVRIQREMNAGQRIQPVVSIFSRDKRDNKEFYHSLGNDFHFFYLQCDMRNWIKPKDNLNKWGPLARPQRGGVSQSARRRRTVHHQHAEGSAMGRSEGGGGEEEEEEPKSFSRRTGGRRRSSWESKVLPLWFPVSAGASEGGGHRTGVLHSSGRAGKLHC